MKILEKKSVFINLNAQYRKNELDLERILEKVSEYRQKPMLGESLISKDTPHQSIRRSILSDFPFMAKL